MPEAALASALWANFIDTIANETGAEDAGLMQFRKICLLTPDSCCCAPFYGGRPGKPSQEMRRCFRFARVAQTVADAVRCRLKSFETKGLIARGNYVDTLFNYLFAPVVAALAGTQKQGASTAERSFFERLQP
ncbi:MAG: hypothetical protein AAF665_09170 [Pseudomonadota bacterium]